MDIDTFQEAHNQTLASPKKRKQLEVEGNLKIPHYQFDFEEFFKKIINDVDIDYSLYDYFKGMRRFEESTDKFRHLAVDLITIKTLVNTKQMNDETFVYFSLHFYASNFDNFVNLLKPIARAIQKHKQYSIVTKRGKKSLLNPRNANGTLKILEIYDSNLYSHLSKFLNRTLRNKVSHEEYRMKNDKVYYDKTYIQRETLFKLIVYFGDLINALQSFEYKYVVNAYTEAHAKKLTKKRFKQFIQDYKI